MDVEKVAEEILEVVNDEVMMIPTYFEERYLKAVRKVLRKTLEESEKIL